MNIDYDKIFKTNETESKHCELFPKNFFMIICGSSGCGKTNLLCNLLLNKMQLIYYDDVYIWCPTLHQSKYQGLQKVLKNKCTCYSESEQILDPQEFDETLYHVICFDDVMVENQSKIVDYFCRGRHNNFNVLYLCQSLYKIKKHGIRDNANIFVLFPQNKKTLKSFYDSYVSSDMEYDEFKEFCDQSWQDKYGYVVINLWSSCDKYKYIDRYENCYYPKKCRTIKTK